YITESDVSTQHADVLNAGHYNYTITRTWRTRDVKTNSIRYWSLDVCYYVIAPTVSCPANVTVNCQDNNTSAATGVATGTDICSRVYITESDVSAQHADVLNACHYNYTITRTWRSTDVTGNYTECAQVITVQD